MKPWFQTPAVLSNYYLLISPDLRFLQIEYFVYVKEWGTRENTTRQLTTRQDADFQNVNGQNAIKRNTDGLTAIGRNDDGQDAAGENPYS